MEDEQGIILFWLGSAIMFLLAVAVVIVSLIYQKRVYQLKQQEAEKQLHTALQAELNERKRIASDLHDGILGDLSALKNYIAVLNNKERGKQEQIILADFNNALKETLINIREVSHNLMPPLIESLTINELLYAYLEKLRKWHDLEITTSFNTSLVPISLFQKHEIYRIIQELCTNSIKHGKVTIIDFTLSTDKNDLILQLVDDGITFDFYEQLANQNGLGLKNIHMRIERLNAKLIQIPVKNGNKLKIIIKI